MVDQGASTTELIRCIENIVRAGPLFHRDGSARRIEFQLQLARVDDDRIDAIGDGEHATEAQR